MNEWMKLFDRTVWFFFPKRMQNENSKPKKKIWGSMKLCCEMPFKPNFEQYLKSEDVEVRLSALQIWFSNGIESEMKIKN